MSVKALEQYLVGVPVDDVLVLSCVLDEQGAVCADGFLLACGRVGDAGELLAGGAEGAAAG